MKLDEVPPLLDVHPPHEPLHGWRDFLIHLTTITIGLLIALSLEGCVEWQHHRHLVHEAEAGLSAEIRDNAKGMAGTMADIQKQKASLKNDVEVLNYFIANGKAPEHSGMEINFHIGSFRNVAWKTAQSTGAVSYMPYERAEEYSEIYSTQDQLSTAEEQAARDAILSLAPLMNVSDNGPKWTKDQADAIKQKIEILQGQLILVESLVKGLDEEQKKFMSTHSD